MNFSPQRNRRGSAVLIVLVLVALMEALLLANTRTLDHLGRELRHLEAKQQKRLGQPPAKPAPPARKQVNPGGPRP
jgi:hypothetical protein